MTLEIKHVTLTDQSKAIRFNTPYHPDLPKRLKALGGKWNGNKQVWYLPDDLEAEARALCLEFFHVDPLAETTEPLLNVRIDMTGRDLSGPSFWDLGREILRRPGRDMPVKPGEGVSIVNGGFPQSGGSRNNPRIGPAQDGTTLLVRNVPQSALKRFTNDHPSWTDSITAEPATPPPPPPPPDAAQQAAKLVDQLAALLISLPIDEQAALVRTLMQKCALF